MAGGAAPGPDSMPVRPAMSAVPLPTDPALEGFLVPRPLFEPIADLRSGPFGLAGVGSRLEPTAGSKVCDANAALELLRQAAACFPRTDLFLSLIAVAGTGSERCLLRLVETAGRAGLPLSRLVLDIEGAVPGEAERAGLLSVLDRIREAGVRLSLSRAGLSETGLELAIEARPDYLRVAAPLVTGCTDDFYKQAVVESIAALGWKLGAAVVAEGVASLAEATVLGNLGVSFALGPYFGPPLEAPALRDRLAAGLVPLSIPPAAARAASGAPAPVEEEP